MKLIRTSNEFNNLPSVFRTARDKAIKEGNYISIKTNPLRGTPRFSFNIGVSEDFDYEYIIVEWLYNEYVLISRKELKQFATIKNINMFNNNFIRLDFSKIQKNPVSYEVNIYAFKDAEDLGSGNIYINDFRNIRTVNDELIPTVMNMSTVVSTFTHNMKEGKTINPVDNEELFSE